MKQYAPSQRNKPRHEEHNLQVACVNWFRYQYRTLEKRLVAVGNGGKRDAITGAMLKTEGVLAGVADLILFVPNIHYHGLMIEMKTKTGRQSEAQKEWQQEIEKYDLYKYVVVRSLEEFMNIINDYLDDEKRLFPF